MMKIKHFFTLAFIFIQIPLARGEYRVYQYYVKSKNKFSMDQKAYKITTSMDSETYTAYHGGTSAIQVDLLRSWMCVGHTGGMRDHCPPPSEVMEKGANTNL